MAKKEKKKKKKDWHECNKKLLLITDLLRSTILLHSLCLGSSTILIGTAYVQSIVATQSAVAGKNISAQNTWNKAELKTKPPRLHERQIKKKKKETMMLIFTNSLLCSQDEGRCSHKAERLWWVCFSCQGLAALPLCGFFHHPVLVLNLPFPCNLAV